MFVAECDIRKFFDSISHDVVRRRWREIGFDAAAERVLAAYLDVYAQERLATGETPVVPVAGRSTGETPVVPVGGRSTGKMPVV